MGEYFAWINPKKRQCLDQDACDDYGWMFGIATMQRCELTEAACNLINGVWNGDPVIFAGDYLSFGNGEHESKNGVLASVFGTYPWDTCFGGEFEELPAPEPIVRYRYAINDDKREYVDRDATPLAVVCELPDGEIVWDRYDPVPALFSPCWLDDKEPYRGRWCLDAVRMSRESPGAGYEDISGKWVRWGETVLLTDEEINGVVHGDAFQHAIVNRDMRRGGDDIELHGAVEAIAIIVRG